MDCIPEIIYLPATANRPVEPAPYLLTEDETIRLLRLDGGDDPYSSLKRYRNKGQLRATQVGKHVRYRLPDVIRFLEKATEENPR
jgi:hypothetical protein